VSICGIPCAAYNLYASAQSLDFLDLAENYSFLIWKLKLSPIVPDFHFWMGTSYRSKMLARAHEVIFETRLYKGKGWGLF
jgi:hypothetical protein